MSKAFRPPQSGEMLREDVLPALGLSVTDAAAQLGVTRAVLSRVLYGRAAISPEMALRPEGRLTEFAAPTFSGGKSGHHRRPGGTLSDGAHG